MFLFPWLLLMTASLGIAGPHDPSARARSRKIRHSLAVRATLPSGWSYAGCKQDAPARLLSGNAQTPSSNTIESCIAYCISGGYVYAGVEYSSQCFCGNTLNSALGQSLPESSCSMPCSGNSAEACGGSYIMNLYTASTAVTWQSLGCYTDSSSPRTLTGTGSSSATMTPALCQSRCEAAGYVYAGVEYSSECYCGNSLDSSRSTSAGACSSACNGDSSKTCGGSWALNIYKLGTASTPSPSSTTSSSATPSSTGWTGLGCFSDSGSPRTLTGQADNFNSNTPASCQAYCSAAGYKYAGVEFSMQCFCGNSLDASLQIDSSRCNSPCTGDSKQLCGAGNAIYIYSKSSATTSTSTSTTSPSPSASGWTSLGCVADNRPGRALTGPADNFNSNTPASCQAYCSGQGYKYAGVEYSYQCFCGNTLNFNIASTDCTATCSGDSSKICGGNNAINLYLLNSATTSTSITPTQSSSAPASSASAWTSIGCYYDSGNPRVLSVGSDSSSMTPALCQSRCLSGGYKYSGVEYGIQCFCDNSMAYSTSSTACTSACGGDSSKICGGGNAITIYLYNGATASSSASPSASSAPPPAFSIAAISGVAAPPASGTKALYAHHMIGNTYNYAYSDWQTQISLAAGAGIDGFALNLGTTTGSQGQNIAWSYQAAQAQGNFKNFLSFDFTAVSCSSATDAQTVAALINKFSTNSAQVVYKGKTLVSSFAGDACTFGQGNTLAGFNYVRSLLTTPMFFIPAIFTDPSTFTQASQAWFDGELNWNSGWPSGAGNLDTSSDTTYMTALGTKTYMPAVSPAFFTYYACGNGGWCKDFIFRSDNWLLATRMEQLISLRNSVDFAELISWNDFGESHYIGPLGVSNDLAMSQGWTTGFPHTAWLKVLAFYAPAFKTGSYPLVSDQMVFWSRPHPKNATPSNPTVGRPTRADDTDDNLYAFVTLSSAAAVKLYSGANSYTWNLPAGPSKLSIANAAGTIGGSITRGSSTIKSYDSSGAFTYTVTPTDYNFNYFVAST